MGHSAGAEGAHGGMGHRAHVCRRVPGPTAQVQGSAWVTAHVQRERTCLGHTAQVQARAWATSARAGREGGRELSEVSETIS